MARKKETRKLTATTAEGKILIKEFPNEVADNILKKQKKPIWKEYQEQTTKSKKTE